MAQPAKKITTAYERRLTTDTQLKEELEQIQKRREDLEEELKMLGLKKGLINDERREIAQMHARDFSEYLDVDAINDLVNACAVQYSDIRMPGDTSFHMSKKIISALKNCQRF